MSEHTPGPWETVPAPQWVLAAVHTRDGLTVCECFRDSATADAQLISAAPDLLEACKVALQQLCVPQHERRDWETIPQLKAAISKAEGRA